MASGKIAPAELVEALIQLERQQLQEEPFGALTLIVRAPEDSDREFLEDLVGCVMKDPPVSQETPHFLATSEFPTLPVQESDPSEEDQVELLSELASAPHCIVPLRGSSRALRIGRAPGSDIVLTDPSVSGQHAELHLEGGGVRVVDLGSKNGTIFNGQRLVPEESPWLQPMDRLAFGRVQAFICDPRALRAVLRQDLRSIL